LPAGFGDVKDELGNPTEQFVKMKVMKSRLGEPGRQVKIKLDWKGGIEAVPTGIYFVIAVEKNLVEYNSKGGMVLFTWKKKDYKIRGKNNYIKFCNDNIEYRDYVLGVETNEEKSNGADSKDLSGFNG